MKRTLILLATILPFLVFAQQPKLKNKKYQGLLWEITGNGLKKTSYLFGTMHVSSKLAFHLADSFYLGIRNADMVALETNPESWQEDMSKYDLGNQYGGYSFGNFAAIPNDYLRINTLKFYKYDKKIEKALYSNPSTINNLLYRSYGNETSDFEEDTYLDMYIYQCGKKWGKKVAGVEKYGESMKLMAEAYKDAAKDKNKKERSYDIEEAYSSAKLQEAYRLGNLDWLDSINKYNSFSAAFDEKFLYKRNDIQAASIDSIIKSGQSLFVGVGAAHLPGDRGVIEILRRLGYKLRPVKMGARDSQHKNQVEKLRVPVVFTTQTADDNFYKVDIPGKFYKFGENPSLDERQYADMANGSYYMVTRIMTNAWMWGHNTDKVNKVVDSLLYENIPGKIVSKTAIIRNGNKGLDIVNKTRRGDIQRYNIFVTPFEIIVFKMSGTADYVQQGDEAKKFFSSIQLKEYAPVTGVSTTYKKYTPPAGGFSIDLPHDPYVGNDGSWIYDAEDKATNTQYRIIRTNIHNFHFVEEDTFDLGLMEESFASSDFVDKQISRKHTTVKGYPALDCQYKDKNGGIYLLRFLIQGPHYYTLVAHGKQETAAMKNFINSFEIKPYIYTAVKERRDTSLYYSVKSPVWPEENVKEKLAGQQQYGYGDDGNDEELTENDRLQNGTYRSKLISNDTTGEQIFVSFFKAPLYAYVEDSTVLDKENQTAILGDTSWLVRMRKKYELPNKMKVWESIVSDTGSSRSIWAKTFYNNGLGFVLVTQLDTLSKPSAFVQSFYDSFTPADTLKGSDIFKKKSGFFFADFMSTDSVAHKRAVTNISTIKLDSTDLPQLKKAIASIDWKEKKYLETKKSLIGKLDVIKTRKAADYLKESYFAAGDTLELQYTALEILLQQKTPYAYNLFKDIMLTETPVLNVGKELDYTSYLRSPVIQYRGGYKSYSYDNGDFMDELYDSLPLTRTILTDLLPLINIDDYKTNMMRLLGQMVDSNLVKAKDYEVYFSKFLIEAKQELKKQAIAEKQKAIKKAEDSKEDKKDTYSLYGNNNDNDAGNDNLQMYATLLLPYWDSKPVVQPVIKQMLASDDKRLKYSTMLLLLRNNKPFPDSLLTYFAKLDDYRYELYTDLEDIDQLKRFPPAYNQHIDLGKSKLLQQNAYSKPDSVVYMDRLPAEVKGKKGFVYFFKYKTKKDDASWKLATVGLVPENPAAFEFDAEASTAMGAYAYDENRYESSFDFTFLGGTKIKEDEPLKPQLVKELKKLLYSKRKSGKQFYAKNDYEEYADNSVTADYDED